MCAGGNGDVGQPRERCVSTTNRNFENRQGTAVRTHVAGAAMAGAAAVTGTNGKTSVAHFTRQLWTLLGHRAGSLGTLGVVAPGHDHAGALTTPDPIELHRLLAELALGGIDHLAMEASSQSDLSVFHARSYLGKEDIIFLKWR